MSTFSVESFLMDYLRNCQKEAEKENPQYPEDFNIMPNDAILLVREQANKTLCSIIEEGVDLVIKDDTHTDFSEANKEEAIAFVVNRSVRPNKDAVVDHLRYVNAGLTAILRKYPESNESELATT